jgi:activator of HSP90 ATPase
MNHLATRRDVITAISIGMGGLVMANKSGASVSEEISRSQEAIHQEVFLHAIPERVYSALTEAELFQKVTSLSAAVSSGMVKSTKPAQIDASAGGTFSLFGGIIAGRFVELVPNERIVQAWRAADWAPGVYSIARFELHAAGKGTNLVFDHTSFPAGAAEHLAAGWKGNYWEPLERALT